MQSLFKVVIQHEGDVPLVRQRAQQFALLAGMSIWDQTRLATAISEVSHKLYKNSPGVQVEFGLSGSRAYQSLQVDFRSLGAVDLSPEAFNEADLTNVRRLVDSLSIRVEPDFGVEIHLVKNLPSEVAPVSAQTASEWSAALKLEAPRGAMEEIRRQNLELLQILETLRHKELALERQLRETRKLEKARDDLIHAMVHDLRNPLTTIHTSLEGLLTYESDQLSEYQRSMAEIACQGTEKMVKLVDNILDVSRLESGQMPLNYAPLLLPQMVEETLRAQMPLAASKEIRLEHSAPPDFPPVQGDRELIGRVLQNLVDNALKFTPRGGWVKVELLVEDTPSEVGTDHSTSYVLVSVSDSGPGISPEIESRLFDKFVTGPDQGRGSGLGLAFCKLVVTAHGGKISAGNRPGQGANFTFTLPLF